MPLRNREVRSNRTTQKIQTLQDQMRQLKRDYFYLESKIVRIQEALLDVAIFKRKTQYIHLQDLLDALEKYALIEKNVTGKPYKTKK
ncbi:MAG: hypothetical protein ABH986_06970 [archaeon]